MSRRDEPRRPADATATVAVRVRAPVERTFALFTGDLDAWWRRGPKYRHAGRAPGTVSLEPRLGGSLRERWTEDDVEHTFELGVVTAWEPPRRIAFTWRNRTFAATERTEVEVTFEPMGQNTLVTVRHRGWEALRKDHPARHGEDDVELARSVGMWWAEQLEELRRRASA